MKDVEQLRTVLELLPSCSSSGRLVIDLCSESLTVDKDDLVMSAPGTLIRNGMLAMKGGARFVCKSPGCHLIGVCVKCLHAPSCRIVTADAMVLVPSGADLCVSECSFVDSRKVYVAAVRVFGRARILKSHINHAHNGCLSSGTSARLSMEECSMSRIQNRRISVDCGAHSELRACVMHEGYVDTLCTGSVFRASGCTLRDVNVRDGATGVLDGCQIRDAVSGAQITDPGTTLVATDSVFSGNQHNLVIGLGARCVLRTCTISAGKVSAGIDVSNLGSKLAASRCTFDKNAHAGVRVHGGGSAYLEDCALGDVVDVHAMNQTTCGFRIDGEGSSARIRGCTLGSSGCNMSAHIHADGACRLEAEACTFAGKAFWGISATNGCTVHVLGTKFGKFAETDVLVQSSTVKLTQCAWPPREDTHSVAAVYISCLESFKASSCDALGCVFNGHLVSGGSKGTFRYHADCCYPPTFSGKLRVDSLDA